MKGIDIETTALDPADGKISLVQVADPLHKRVDVYDVLEGNFPQLPREGIAHNAVFEWRWLEAAGFDVQYEDTMIASQVFYTGTNAAKGKLSHSLSAVVKRELKRELAKDEQTSDWGALALTREQIEYAAEDARVLVELSETLMRKIRRAKLEKVYELKRRVSHAVAAMERRGVAVHVDKLDELIEESTTRAEELKSELAETWGINPGSSKQLREHFRLDERKDWPKTPAGAPKTDQEAMKRLLDEEPSVAKWVEWKEIEKIRSTYGKSIRDKLTPEGRVHARFKPFGTATGRFSSSTPNLQNIPKRGELGARLRGLFWSGAEDRVLIKADYASIELWVAAILWDDPHMQHALEQGVNMHVATAAALFNVKPGRSLSKPRH
jgi:DNA polymerase I